VKIYSAQFIIVEKDMWFSKTPPYTVVRENVSYRIHTHIFMARFLAEAYKKAMEMASGMTDEHHDGLGDRTSLSCVGLYDFEELALSSLSVEELCGPYGIEVSVGPRNQSSIDPKSKEELTIFVTSDKSSLKK
jgi:hypothetical protein